MPTCELPCPWRACNPTFLTVGSFHLRCIMFLSKHQAMLQTAQTTKVAGFFFWYPETSLFPIPLRCNATLNCLRQLDKSFSNHSAQTLVTLPFLLLWASAWNDSLEVCSAVKHPRVDLLPSWICQFFRSLTPLLLSSFQTAHQDFFFSGELSLRLWRIETNVVDL